MTDFSSPFFTEAASYDVRRSGSGSVSRPSCLGQPFPEVHRRPFQPGQHPTVAALYRRVYGRALRPRLRGVAQTDATPILG
ncbi:hypothetical protein [Azospirillum argentinense]|uniref:Uncharacterized protein n=1 Tax=Azospirillum brasilense TaxID=192 RepID=A0A4D8QCC2_AZOBR|nr:hypothetical protein [Azospirillum argentinense]QCO07394.1 hypothetical protein D3867_36590 [Azospirillum argentinense]